MTTFAGEAVNGNFVVPRIGGFGADAMRYRRPIGRHRGRSADAPNTPSFRKQIRSANDHLAGNASPVRTLTADKIVLDPHHIQTGVREGTGHLFTAGAEADHNYITFTIHGRLA